MKVLFSKYAEQELNDAVHFYELEYEGLGRKFREEVKKAVIRINDNPVSLGYFPNALLRHTVRMRLHTIINKP